MNVYQKAQEILKERGWCQYAYQEDGRVCVATAIHYAAGGEPIEEDWFINDQHNTIHNGPGEKAIQDFIAENSGVSAEGINNDCESVERLLEMLNIKEQSDGL